MNRFLHSITSFLLLFCVSIFAQPSFTVNTGNPVIVKSIAGAWDDASIWFPCVSVINDTFYTTYVGIPDLSAAASIGLAISTDGFSYTKSPMNPILWGDSSGFDAYAVSGGPIYYDSGTWYLYYSGRDIPSDQPGKIISVATAFNPHGPWNRTNDSLLTAGSNGEWDDGNVYPLSIIVEDDSMYLYYWGGHDWDLGPPASQIGLAISNDNGQTWVKWDDPSTTNAPFSESDPVIKLGPGSYDDFMTRGAGIIKNGAQWEMLYNGSTYPVSGDICYATSDDGIDWNKHANNPILTYLSDPFAINGWFEGSTVAFYNDQYFLYYDYGPGADGIGLATAPRLPGIIKVPAEYPSIQAGINAAIDGDTVLVADSTYYENIMIQSKAVTLASYFLIDEDTSHISRTIINGSQPVNTDNASVIMILDTPELNTICGFTLTGGMGRKKVFPGGAYSQIGGGIDIEESSAIIKKNQIINNSIISSAQALGTFGGGISWGAGVVSGLTLKISGNLISGNEITGKMTGGAGINISNYIKGGELDYLVEDNIVENNTVINTDDWKAMGGGIFLEFILPTIGNQTIRNNIISNNQALCNTIWKHSFGGGLYFVIWDNEISGTIDNDPGPYVYNNIISGNHSDYLGGGVSVWRVYDLQGTLLQSAGNYIPKPSFINNTIVNNTAQDGSGFFIMNHKPFLMNNILWNDHPQNAIWGEIFLGDEPSWIQPNTYGGAEIYYTDIQDTLWPGSGNINIDPKFVAGDSLYNLQHTSDTSRCLNAGTDSIQINGIWYYAPDHDYAGDPRPQPAGTPPDMGAWEYDVVNALEEIQGLPFPKTISLKQNYPNPFNPTTSIEFSIPKSEFVTLKIYNLLGQEVVILVSEKLKSGNYKYTWDASRFASGVYFYRLETNSFTKSKKLVLIR